MRTAKMSDIQPSRIPTGTLNVWQLEQTRLFAANLIIVAIKVGRTPAYRVAPVRHWRLPPRNSCGSRIDLPRHWAVFGGSMVLGGPVRRCRDNGSHRVCSRCAVRRHGERNCKDNSQSRHRLDLYH